MRRLFAVAVFAISVAIPGDIHFGQPSRHRFLDREVVLLLALAVTVAVLVTWLVVDALHHSG